MSKKLIQGESILFGPEQNTKVFSDLYKVELLHRKETIMGPSWSTPGLASDWGLGEASREMLKRQPHFRLLDRVAGTGRSPHNMLQLLHPWRGYL